MSHEGFDPRSEGYPRVLHRLLATGAPLLVHPFIVDSGFAWSRACEAGLPCVRTLRDLARRVVFDGYDYLASLQGYTSSVADRTKPLLSWMMNGNEAAAKLDDERHCIRAVTQSYRTGTVGALRSMTDDAPTKWGSASIYFVLRRTGARNR